MFTELTRNPIAQELISLSAFSGSPSNVNNLLSLYELVQKSAGSLDISTLVGRSFNITYTKNDSTVIGTLSQVKVTEAGISAIAHFIGQGAAANLLIALNDDYNKKTKEGSITITNGAFDVTLVDNGRMADGSHIAASNYLDLVDNYKILNTTEKQGLIGFNGDLSLFATNLVKPLMTLTCPALSRPIET